MRLKRYDGLRGKKDASMCINNAMVGKNDLRTVKNSPKTISELPKKKF